MNFMNPKRYSLSFTSAALLYCESIVVAELYLQRQDWRAVRREVMEANLLQSRTLNTAKRLCSEIFSRLKTCSDKELKLLVTSSPEEKRHLLWIALCRRYTFIGDFALEVVREKFLNLTSALDHEDFDRFFNQKSEWHQELEQIQPSTKIKLRQFLFKMLREAGLLTENNQIQPALFSPEFLEVMADNRYCDLRFFPVVTAPSFGFHHDES
jgi:hypothetical protein